jgi:hypothetical protein
LRHRAILPDEGRFIARLARRSIDMMPTTTPTLQPILHSFAYALDYLCEQVADVTPADMVAQPAGVTNHPAWLIGHLTYACELLGGALGLEPWLPQDWSARYGTGSVPVADAARYEPKDVALAILRDGQARLTRAVEQLDEARLDDPFPDESLRTLFPTIRHALTQILAGHPAFHVGQLSVWRKAMGLPAMRRVFE